MSLHLLQHPLDSLSRLFWACLMKTWTDTHFWLELWNRQTVKPSSCWYFATYMHINIRVMRWTMLCRLAWAVSPTCCVALLYSHHVTIKSSSLSSTSMEKGVNAYTHTWQQLSDKNSQLNDNICKGAVTEAYKMLREILFLSVSNEHWAVQQWAYIGFLEELWKTPPPQHSQRAVFSFIFNALFTFEAILKFSFVNFTMLMANILPRHLHFSNATPNNRT